MKILKMGRGRHNEQSTLLAGAKSASHTISRNIIRS